MQAGAACQGVVRDGQVFLHAGVSGQLAAFSLPSMAQQGCSSSLSF